MDYNEIKNLSGKIDYSSIQPAVPCIEPSPLGEIERLLDENNRIKLEREQRKINALETTTKNINECQGPEKRTLSCYLAKLIRQKISKCCIINK